MKPLSKIPKRTSVFITKTERGSESESVLEQHQIKPKQMVTVISTNRTSMLLESQHNRFTIDKKIADSIIVSEVLSDLEQAFEGNQTKQRETILGLLKRTKEHFTLEEFVKKVQRANPRIGQVTVYRALKTLTAKGVLEVFIMPDGSRKFEIRRGYHDHIICEGCGSIYDFYDEDLEQHHLRIARKHGVILERHKMQLFGQRCPQCVKPAAGVIA